MVAKVLRTCVLQVLRKFCSDSVHVAPLETAWIITVEMSPYCGPMSHETRSCLAQARQPRWGWRCDGASVWGIGLGGCRFLCAGKYIALLIEHEWGGSQHPTHEGVTFPGILFMTCKRKGSWMVGYLCSCPGCAVTRHLRLVAFQGVRKEARYVTANWW